MVTQWHQRADSRKHKCSFIELTPLACGGEEYDQLAAHCAYGLGAPILGDPTYRQLCHQWMEARGQPINATFAPTTSYGHLFLHHRSITFQSSSGERVKVVCPLPDHIHRLFQETGWTRYYEAVDKRSYHQSHLPLNKTQHHDYPGDALPKHHVRPQGALDDSTFQDLLLSNSRDRKIHLKPLVLHQPSGDTAADADSGTLEFPDLR